MTDKPNVMGPSHGHHTHDPEEGFSPEVLARISAIKRDPFWPAYQPPKYWRYYAGRAVLFVSIFFVLVYQLTDEQPVIKALVALLHAILNIRWSLF